jgi:hypothetical protein
MNKLKKVIQQEMIKNAQTKYIKAKETFVWDGYSHEIEDITLKENFHIIVTFKDGTIKDVNAMDFINNERFGMFFNELRDNIELFLEPIMVDQYGIAWTDDADIASEWLWNLGKDIEIGKTAIKKVAFAKIKDLSWGITIIQRTKEDNHKNTPHFRLSKGNEIVGVIAVDTPNSSIDRIKKENYQEFKETQSYVQENKEILTKIYNAKDGEEMKELAKQLPNK